jgi:hypothetical protein
LRTPHIAAPLAALLLASCFAMVKVGPGPVAIGDGFSVKLDSAWNRFEAAGTTVFAAPGATEVWTAEGMTLDVLAFYIGIREGETLGRALQAGSGRKLPTFRAKMTPHEIVELYENLVTQDGSAFRLGRLAPARFGGVEGFRFEHSLTRKRDSLPLEGVGYGAVVNGRLYLIAYSAPKTHYFAKLLPRVEAVAASASIKR